MGKDKKTEKKLDFFVAYDFFPYATIFKQLKFTY